MALYPGSEFRSDYSTMVASSFPSKKTALAFSKSIVDAKIHQAKQKKKKRIIPPQLSVWHWKVLPFHPEDSDWIGVTDLEGVNEPSSILIIESYKQKQHKELIQNLSDVYTHKQTDREF